MTIAEDILNLLNKDYRDDTVTIVVINALSNWINSFKTKIENLYKNFFFDKLTLDGVEYFENLLLLTPQIEQTLDDRRASIQAKWLTRNHNCIELIQKVCNAWKNGETKVNFLNGKIHIKFLGSFGVPDYVETLKEKIEDVKPAHIAYEFEYKYLLIKNIHEIKTIAQMEQITIEQFASGVKNE